ncbi:FAD-dependent oxidoreductase [Paenibacillus athensensis]|uniref:FAD-dependent oxidoreductase n=1 Tax=Paenibacillus athensensis TaxID=1967502 RepID=A0A4Y8Q7H1_9BACL|nr:FAD-dependent oxidoreductase [Paenibacillus athensensis]MCD1259709.1 FAD-dependent oxidoreductase [Paenibacillus athensensis]
MRFVNKRLLVPAVALALLAGAAIPAGKLWPRDRPASSGPSSSEHVRTQVPPATPAAATPAATPAAMPQATPEAVPAASVTSDVYGQEQADVVVFGSELEGLYLARAAADEGLKVQILDPRSAFGGQLLQGQMLFLDETRDEKGKSLVQGRAKELFDGFKSGKIRKLSEFTAYMNKLAAGIPLESGIHIQAIHTTDTAAARQSITSVDYTTADGQQKHIAATYWVDNTDFAALLSRLKTTRLPGLEKLYGQQHIEYMGAGMMMAFKNVDWAAFNHTFNDLSAGEKKARFGGGYVNDSFAIGLSGMTQAYKPTNERVFLRGLNAVNQKDGQVLINALLVYTVDPSDDKSVAEAVELGQRETPLILEHFRKTLPGWAHAELNGLPAYPYIREYNHYEMDYDLQMSDLLSGKMNWDDVSIAGYPIDLQGTSANKWGIEMGRPDKYGMPLRSFLLKGYDNVIAAGKNVGASAIAFGSARIQPNTSLAAESIGVILGRIHGKQTLRDLQPQDMRALHEYLAAHDHIQLEGIAGANKLVGWSADEIGKLNDGAIIYTTYKHHNPSPPPTPSPSPRPSQQPSASPQAHATPGSKSAAPAAAGKKQTPDKPAKQPDGQTQPTPSAAPAPDAQ